MESVPKDGELNWTRGRVSLGLQGKIVVMSVAIALTVIVSMVLLSIVSLTDAFNHQYRDKGLAIVSAFDAHYGANAGMIDSAKDTQEFIDRLIALNPNIFKISLYAREGDDVLRIASSDRGEVGEVADADDMLPIDNGQTLFVDREGQQGEKMVEVLAPLHLDGQVVAAVGVYLMLQPRDAAVRDLAVRFASFGTIAALLLLAVFYYCLNRILLEPLMLLRQSFRALGYGNLSTRLAIRRNDEIGDVAHGFNRMAKALERREKENQDLHKQLQERYAEAQEQAITDPLTGLYNHRYFQERLTEELGRANRHDTPVTLLFADLDNFKAYNDACGHQFGDRILGESAQLLKATMRDIDMVARYGGDEFAIILPSTDREGGLIVAERLRTVIASHQMPSSNPALREAITVSIGLATSPEDGISREDLVWKADCAMYFAKQLGRNQVRTYRELVEPDEAMSRDLGDDDLSKEAYLNFARSLAAAADARDHYTQSHSESVARHALATARFIGVSGRQLQIIGTGALLHDIGKIGVPDAILTKSGPLSLNEWEKMREHPSIGESIVRTVASLEHVVPLICSHHERYDGSGYPRGLKGDEIPLGARIIAIADAYHSMTSQRPYRDARPHEEAVTELRRNAGTQFDPALVEAFISAYSTQGDVSTPEGIYQTILQATGTKVDDTPRDGPQEAIAGTDV